MSKIWLEKLREVMAERGLKAKPLSLAAGLNENYIRDLVQKNVDPTLTKMSALADVLGLPLTYFFTDEPTPWPTIRVVGYAAGGEEWQPVDDGDELPVVDFASLDLSNMDPIAIRVRGHSMSPVFRDGDDLVCERHRGQDLAQAVNRDCVVKTMDNRYFVKQILKGSLRNTFRLRSYNPAFDDLENVALEWAAPVIWIKRRT
jgi:phage repressor protein C with HTH and peptisase S24 domain